MKHTLVSKAMGVSRRPALWPLVLGLAGALLWAPMASAAGATVTVNASPNSGGTVSGDGAYLVGDPVQLFASANSGWDFIAWNDGVTDAIRTTIVPAGGAQFTALFNLNLPAGAPMQFTTLAGLAGSAGSSNGTGSMARLNYPQSLAVGATGMVYVADTINHLIRQITPAGLVSTLAGTAGVAGSSNAIGTAARFNTPYAVAADGAGNVFVADSGNHTIRKIAPDGSVTTVAGLANSSGSANGPGSVARFKTPAGLALDGFGNLLVADTGNHTIRQITPDGTVSTLAGLAGSAGSSNGIGSLARFNYPQSLTVDAHGTIYVADTFNHTIRSIAAGGVVTTWAGTAGSAGSADGTALDVARFNHPYGVAADHAGHVYVSDSDNHTIRAIDASGVVSTLGGLAGSSGSADGTGAAAHFFHPAGLAADSAGDVFVADTYNHTIRQGSYIQTTDVEVADFAITWPAEGNLRGLSPTAVSLTVTNKSPWDLATNTFILVVSLRNPDNWDTLGTYQFPLAVQSGHSTTLSLPASAVVIPTNYGMGTWEVLVQFKPLNNALVGPYFFQPLGFSDPVRIPGFLMDSEPTLNGQVPENRSLTVAPGASVSGSFMAGLQNGQDPAALMTTLIGFVDSNNLWVGGDPQVIYSTVPPITSTNEAVAWSALMPPAAPGLYTLRYKTYLTWEVSKCLDQFKSNPPTHADSDNSYYMEGIVGTVRVAQPTDLQALGMSLILPVGDPRGQSPAALSVFLKNNGPGVWDGSNTCRVEAFLAASGASQDAWIYLGAASISPQLVNGQTVTNALAAADLGRFSLPLYLAGGTYTFWLEITPLANAPLDTNPNDNWAAGNTFFMPRYAPPGQFHFTTWLGQLWTSGSANGVGGAASFNDPYCVAADAFGNYYIADTLNHTIRKVTPAGLVTVLAGAAGRSGSADGTGSAARFNTPMGVAVDGSGNVYVAGCYNDAIRKITPAGVVTTLAGRAGQAGIEDGTGSVARFSGPYAVAADSTGTVYVADTWNHTIRRVTPAGAVTTLAGLANNPGSADGPGSYARFYAPQGIAVSPNGMLYVTDTDNHTIRQITQAGIVSTLAGLARVSGSADGTGSAARFNTPTGIAVDGGGYIYVADSGNQAIRGLNLYGVTSTLGGKAGTGGQADGTGSAARFNGPQSVAMDRNGYLLVADTYNSTIRLGTLVTTATIYVAASPANGGSVTGGGGFVIGTNVTLTAVPNAGWAFSRWSDGVMGTNRTVLLPTADAWYTACFLPKVGVAVDAPAMDWSTGGDAAWFGQMAASHDNLAAAQSGAIGAGQTSYMQVTTNGPGSLQFWWKVSSASDSCLQFYIDTQLVSQISGNADWAQFVTYLGTSNQVTLKWVYTKASAAVAGSDAGWVDQVAWQPCPYAERVPQLFYQDPSGMLASWVLNGAGGFRFVRLLANTGGWVLKAAGDIDGDGVSDLLFQDRAGNTGGWFMNPDGSVRDARFWFNIGAWEIKACGDFEGSGTGQLFFQTARGDTAYWRLNTDGSFQASVPLGIQGSWKLRGAGDLNGDGKAELFWQNAAGLVAIWYHNPDGSIRGAVRFDAANWALCGVADIDGDGVCDLLWQTPGGDTGAWFMNSDSTVRTANYWWNTGGWKLRAAGR